MNYGDQESIRNALVEKGELSIRDVQKLIRRNNMTGIRIVMEKFCEAQPDFARVEWRPRDGRGARRVTWLVLKNPDTDKEWFPTVSNYGVQSSLTIHCFDKGGVMPLCSNTTLKRAAEEPVVYEKLTEFERLKQCCKKCEMEYTGVV